MDDGLKRSTVRAPVPAGDCTQANSTIGSSSSQMGETLVDHFRAVLLGQPDHEIYRFLEDGEGELSTLTNAELDLRARAVAATLQQRVPAGERALIVCPPGLDYVTSFFACLYAGVIAVPVYPPNPVHLKRTLSRLIGVIADSQPAVVLAPTLIASIAGQVADYAPTLSELSWQTVDDIDTAVAETWRPPAIKGQDVAFLQYTSGSTGQPKGVMVTHANLLHNLEVTNQMFFGPDEDPNRHLVVWLPPYHDMGLIGGLLQPAYGAFPVTFMSPLAFLKRPVRWLRVISECAATISGGPNFAYDLCVEKTSAEEREGLDLSTWALAFNGAEPIRAETIDRFSRAFEECGFQRKAFYPCYGLAEATLLTAGSDRAAEPVVRQFRADSLARDAAVRAHPGDDTRTSVGCGQSVPGQEIVIADPENRTRLAEGRVGEIWVSGPSVAEGYWRSPAATEAVFSARLVDTGEGPFLRTGDLGFLDHGELFVTGRRKDLIIIAGRNHYPQDIELSAERSHPALRPGCGVACSVDVEGGERLLIVHEVSGKPKADEADQIISSVRAAVAEDHDVQVHDVVLVRRGAVPKTSSGKLQRAACRDAFLAGTLDPLASWSLSAQSTPRVGALPASGTSDEQTSSTSREIEQWMATEVARRAKLPTEAVDPRQPIAAYGLGSVDMIGLVGELERRLDRKLPATLLWEYPTIAALSAFLSAPAASDVLAGASTEQAGTGRRARRAQVAEPSGESTGAAQQQHREEPGEPIAIIGIGCRFPGEVDSPDGYWQLLCDGRDAITEVPADRWNVADFLDDNPDAPGKTTTRWGGFVDGIDTFDPQFFGISPREAARMDPQQRLLAEVAWEALEDAGVVTDHLAGSRTGVFVGIATNDYGRLQLQDFARIDAFTGTGNAFSIAANRLSYLFDLRGPSMAIDTACSSSLVAVYQACLSLAQGDCSLALAGGVNLVLSPELAINFSKAGAMAPDGRCKAFDARANGYVRAEGAGIIVLKPFSQALADGDRIYATIRGGAVNQDGRTNGLMAPNPHAQEAVLRAAYAKAGVPPESVQYVEAHGTGTLLGDTIEAKALAAVVGAGRDSSRPCLIGSVKSNIGHLEAAAGVAGLIKVALMVRNGKVPPSLHYRQPNPHIPFHDLPIEVADSLRPWPADRGPALAGVSSFGFGGTNAHLVVQEAPVPLQRAEAPAPRAHLLTISARSRQSLRDLAARYEAHIVARGSELNPAELCSAAAVRRVHHEYRLACVGTSLNELREGLKAYARDEESPGLSSGNRAVGWHVKVAFVFSGQGPRWWPLGTDLIRTEPVFREVIERCDVLLRRHVDWSLLEQLTGDPGSSRITDTAVGQPALCAVQVALAALWQSWGIKPEAVVGHSVGEIAAAYVSGALSLEDALRVALHRGRAINAAVGKGRMAVAGLSFEQAQQALARLDPGPVWVSASNGPNTTVLSGETSALERVVGLLDADGVFCRLLESVSFASHCPQMDPLLDQLRRSLTGIEPHSAAIPMISTVTGELIDGARLDAEYWAMNLRQPVLFDHAVTAAIDSGHDAFVEISPHPMLGDAITDRMDVQHQAGAVVHSLRRDEPYSMLDSLGRLYCAGFPVDWQRIYGTTVPMVSLPSYSWQRERCWLDDEYGRRRRSTRSGHPILETFVRSAAEPGAYHWTAQVDLEGFPYLRDHRVAGTAVLPASLMLDVAFAAAREVLGEKQLTIEDVRFIRMAAVDEAANGATLQLVLLPETATTGSFRIFTSDGEPHGSGWTHVVQGRFRVQTPSADARRPAEQALAAVRGRCSQPVDCDEHYASLSRAGLYYGPSFQGIDRMWRGEHEAVARLRDLAELTTDQDAYVIHPAILDSCLQVLAAALDPAVTQAEMTYLPVKVDGFTVLSEDAAPRWAQAVLRDPVTGEPEITGGKVVLFDEAGDRVGEVDGITLRRVESAGPHDPVSDSLLEVRWDEVPANPSEVRAETQVSAGWWLLFADRDGVCGNLRSKLLAGGAACVTVSAGESYRRLGEDHYEINPSRREDVTMLLADLRATQPSPCTGVVHAWSLDAVLAEDDGPDQLSAAQSLGGISVLHLVQALSRVGWTPRLALVTRGAQRTGMEETAPAVAQSALWGLARVMTLEHGELRPTIIDLDPTRPDDEAPHLLDEVLGIDGADQVALRGGKRYVPRLEPWSIPAKPDVIGEQRPFDAGRDGNYRILATRPGTLDSLTPTLWRRTRPGPGQVEIEVAAAGLNFSDVLKAMDLYPGLPPGVVPLGAECAGRVTAVGEGVDSCAVGDVVMGIAPSSMAAFTTTAAQLVAPKPEALTIEQGAATPVAFMTAIYGLEYLAHLSAGEKVLIHSAAGGVGMAALQIARRNGAEIFATAGTEEKRELLRTLGVKHVMDSRSLHFADEVMDLTDGRGVDVVLNSLSGEALTRSLSLLAPHGRFVEIGKQDIYNNSYVGLEAFKQSRSFFAVDLEHCIAERPGLIAKLFHDIVHGFDTGDLKALPVTTFTYSKAEDAYAHMARARHVGKIVLRPEGGEAITVPPGDGLVKESATYLITGGLGALGLETAKYLVDEGARHLVLLGRHGPSAEAVGVIEALRSAGADVRVRSADVSRFDDVAAVLADMDSSMPPLAGIVHAAGVLDDGLLLQLDQERFQSVATPKVAGAWHLHRATRDRDLDFFVLFSSAAALLGSPSQGNYAAANAFLDSLALYRRCRGLPALSINWGPWSEIGLAARPDRGGALSTHGIVSLRPDEGIAALDRLLGTSMAQVCVLPLDREKLRAAAASGLLPGLLANLQATSGAQPVDARRGSGDIRAKLLAIEPGRRRRALLVQECKAVIARVLKLDESRVDPTAPLANMGFDSLMSLELRKRLEASLDVQLSATVAWRFPTIDALVPFLAERMGVPLEAGTAPSSQQAAVVEQPADDRELELEQLPVSELESLLLAKITQINGEVKDDFAG